jgi:hypothetical protein
LLSSAQQAVVEEFSRRCQQDASLTDKYNCVTGDVEAQRCSLFVDGLIEGISLTNNKAITEAAAAVNHISASPLLALMVAPATMGPATALKV